MKAQKNTHALSSRSRGATSSHISQYSMTTPASLKSNITWSLNLKNPGQPIHPRVRQPRHPFVYIYIYISNIIHAVYPGRHSSINFWSMRSSSHIFQQTDYIRASDPFISNDSRRHPSLSFGQALRNCRCVLLRPPDTANQWPLWTDPNDETVLHQRNKQPHYELSQVHTVASQLKIICSHDNLILLAY